MKDYGILIRGEFDFGGFGQGYLVVLQIGSWYWKCFLQGENSFID